MTLLAAGANPAARTVTGSTPLHYAKTSEAVTALLEAGADMEARDFLGQTPLHFAALNETGAAVMTLLGAGAAPAGRTVAGELRCIWRHNTAQPKP